ncbi:MAG TPA: sulfite exporter TauE/SafE family protein [Acidimicrobiales bacterium]|nr:sulfite exporter TauE/SafE family protein [Acidimicrobiales bacterium]
MSEAITLGSVGAVGSVVFASAILQRAVGFGFALLAVPLLAFVVPTKSAVVIVFLNGTLTCAWLTLRLHRDAEWSTVRQLGAGALIGAPVGVVVLRFISAGVLRLILGVTIVTAATWIIVLTRVGGARPAGSRRLTTFTTGVISGVLNTALATNGPPLVYELRRRGFSDDRFRATISSVFLISNVIGLPLLVVAGLVSAYDVAYAAVSLLPLILGIAAGSWIGRRMAPGHFIITVDALLLATGVLTVVKALT